MTPSNNAERMGRILDAASGLFLHYGFDKTTVSDIARQAGVSKGTIYLHVDSKDHLLEELILRELKTYAEAWLARLEADPQGGTIAGMYKDSLYALSSSSFMATLSATIATLFYTNFAANKVQGFAYGKFSGISG